jgi:hypothetical protein
MGHKRTIRPNAKKLSALFTERHQMNWDTFSRKVKSCQKGFMGEPDEMRPGRGEFHEFPYSCVCKKPFSDDETGYMEPVTKVKSTYNQKKVGEKSLPMLKKTSMAEEPTALADSEDNEFLSD